MMSERKKIIGIVATAGGAAAGAVAAYAITGSIIPLIVIAVIGGALIYIVEKLIRE